MLEGPGDLRAALRALEHDEALGGVFAARVGAGAAAVEELGLARRAGGIGDGVEDRVAEGGEQRAAGVEDLHAVGFEWRGGVRAGAGGAVLGDVAPGLAGGLDALPFQEQPVRLGEAAGARDQHQRALPEVLVLVVAGEALAQVAGLADVDLGLGTVLALAEEEIHRHLLALGHGEEDVELRARHLDELHDAGGDLGDADAARVAERQEDLDGLRARGGGHAGSGVGSAEAAARWRTSILPVTAAEIRAVRRSWSSAMVDSASSTKL